MRKAFIVQDERSFHSTRMTAGSTFGAFPGGQAAQLVAVVLTGEHTGCSDGTAVNLDAQLVAVVLTGDHKKIILLRN